MLCVNTSTIFNDASTVQYARFVYQIACGKQVLQSKANAQCSLPVLSMLAHSYVLHLNACSLAALLQLELQML
jgi:hypothetical protein